MQSVESDYNFSTVNHILKPHINVNIWSKLSVEARIGNWKFRSADFPKLKKFDKEFYEYWYMHN